MTIYGRELFYWGADKIMSVEIHSGSAFDTGVPKYLFGIYPKSFWPYDVSQDGQRFLTNDPIPTDLEIPLTLVMNWMADLK